MKTHNTIPNAARKLIVAVLAGGALAATGCAHNNPVDPVTNPQGLEYADVDMEIPEYDATFARTGTLVRDTSLFNRITPGIPAAQVKQLLGKPRRITSGKLGKEWNYNFTLVMPVSENYLVCQYKVVFDDKQRVRETVWRRDQCLDVVQQTAAG